MGQNSSIMREPLLGKVGERKCETNTHTHRERERQRERNTEKDERYFERETIKECTKRER